jgi:hypothetical protein
LLLLSREVQAWKLAKKLFFAPATDFCKTVMKLSHKFILISSAVGLIVSNTSWAATGLSPVTTNLTLWLEADQGLASNGSTWADQSGLGNNATALPSGNPTVVPGVYNGLPAVKFSGQAMSFAAPVITTQKFTIVVLAIDKTNKHSSNTAAREIFSNWDGTNSDTSVFLGTTFINPTKVRFTDAIGGQDQGQTGVGMIGKPQNGFILTGVSATNDAKVYLNGKLLYNLGSAIPPRDLSTSFYLGEQGSFAGEYWNGDIEEILVYSVALTQKQINQNVAYLKAKYALP